MGTIIWIFYNVVPWVWLVTTIIFFIVVILAYFLRDEDYSSAWDFATIQTGLASIIVNIFGVLMVALVAFSIEKLYGWFRKEPQKKIESERADAY